MTLGVAYVPKVERIAEIGLGGGRTVSYLSASLPTPASSPLSSTRMWSNWPRNTSSSGDRNVRTVVSDGRAFLLKDSEKWDVILSTPTAAVRALHLLTKEFYTW